MLGQFDIITHGGGLRAAMAHAQDTLEEAQGEMRQLFSSLQHLHSKHTALRAAAKGKQAMGAEGGAAPPSSTPVLWREVMDRGIERTVSWHCGPWVWYAAVKVWELDDAMRSAWVLKDRLVFAFACLS